MSLIPANLMAEFRAEEARREGKPKSRTGAMAVVTVWLMGMGLLLWWSIFRAVR